MMFARGPNGLIAVNRNQQAQQVRPQPAAAQDRRQPQAQPQDDGSTAHLRARINTLEQANAGLNARLSKLEQAFGMLVKKLAVRSAQPQPRPVSPSGARVPEVVERGGSAAPQGRSFDDEIEDAIAMSGGDDEDIPFGG
jgi:hypothetical protein